MDIYRQGDVILIKVKDLPKEAELVENKEKHRVALAYGEVTGHAHALYDVTAANQYKTLEKEFLEVVKNTELRHEEHSTIYLEPGIYEKRIAREYVNENMVRKVVD